MQVSYLWLEMGPECTQWQQVLNGAYAPNHEVSWSGQPPAERTRKLQTILHGFTACYCMNSNSYHMKLQLFPPHHRTRYFPADIVKLHTIQLHRHLGSLQLSCSTEEVASRSPTVSVISWPLAVNFEFSWGQKGTCSVVNISSTSLASFLQGLLFLLTGRT